MIDETLPELTEDKRWMDVPDSLVDEPDVWEVTAKKNGLVIAVDWQRTEAVLGTLLDRYEAMEFPYNRRDALLPQAEEHLPENLIRGGVEHSMFLWTVCYYMRGGQKSVDAFRTVAALYVNHPELFECEVAAAQDPENIASILVGHSLAWHKQEISGFWVENARRLLERWQGDPRKIFEGVKDYRVALERIKNDGKGSGFKGFQEKMVSMIAYYLMDDGLIEPFFFPPPVDFHVLRATIANGLVQFKNVPEDGDVLTDETLEMIRKLYLHYVIQHRVDPKTMASAVWLLSNALCSKHPGNLTHEPHGREGRKGRKTVLIPYKVKLDDPLQRKAYAGACALCPVEDTCTTNIPSAEYYISGRLILRGPRAKLPPPDQGVLFTSERH